MINSKTEVYGLIGNPVSHSMSPLIHNTFFNYLKLNKIYTTFTVVENNLKSAIEGAFALGIKGINITLPFKQSVMPYLYKTEDVATKICSVNTLKYSKDGYIGYNTDITGIEQTLAELGKTIKSKNILILGAGGTGYTCALMALKNECENLIIANRTLDKANKLKAHLEGFYKNSIITLDINDILKLDILPDIVINTTSLGFGENVNYTPIDEEFFNKFKPEFLLDMIYSPWKTNLLKLAEKYNIQCTNGFSPLIYQALNSQEIWIGKEIKQDYKNYVKRCVYKKILSIS